MPHPCPDYKFIQTIRIIYCIIHHLDPILTSMCVVDSWYDEDVTASDEKLCWSLIKYKASEATIHRRVSGSSRKRRKNRGREGGNRGGGQRSKRRQRGS